MQRTLRKGQLPEPPVARVLVELLPALMRLTARDQPARHEPEDATIDLVQRPPAIVLDPTADELLLLGAKLRICGHPPDVRRYCARWLDGGTLPLMRRYVIRLP